MNALALAPPPPAADPPNVADPSAVTDPPARRRGPSVFPVLDAPRPRSIEAHGAAAQVLWSGLSPALRAQVADHADAVGAVLADADAPLPGVPVRAEVCDPAALAGPGRHEHAHGLGEAGRAPLLIVAEGGEVTEDAWRRCLAAGARHLLRLPRDSEDLLGALTALERPSTRGLIVAVAGGSGGAGASSTAARLAGALARRSRGEDGTVLVDADPLGGGLDELVEAAAPGGIRWSDIGLLGPEDGPALREGLPEIDGVRLLAAQDGPTPTPDLARSALTALAGTDARVIVDVGTELAAAVLEAADRLLLIIRPTDYGVRSAARRLDAWPRPHGGVGIIVRGGGAWSARDAAEELGGELLGSFRDHPRTAVPLLDRRRGGADRLCSRLAAELLAEGAPS